MAWKPECSGQHQAPGGSLDHRRAPQVLPATTESSDEWRGHAELVRRVYGKEPGADEELHALIVRCVRFRLMGALGHHDLGDDRTHDTYIDVLDAIRSGRLREPERLMGFIQTIARRKIVAFIRSASRARMTIDMKECAPLKSADSPFETHVLNEHRQVLAEAMMQLRPLERELLRRFYVMEQDEPTIRRAMGLSATQFRLAKSRGKLKMVSIARELLESRPKDFPLGA
jgi:RNA polymerase sigma-70 factor (ECF subfamily)